MKIQIETRTYEATRDSNGWTLSTPTVVIDKKTNQEKAGHRDTYYTFFSHLLESIIDREMGHCESLQEVITKIEALEAMIEKIKP